MAACQAVSEAPDLLTAPPLFPPVALPEDRGLPEFSRLFDSEWVWRAYCSLLAASRRQGRNACACDSSVTTLAGAPSLPAWPSGCRMSLSRRISLLSSLRPTGRSGSSATRKTRTSRG